jgi:hypothetical protein
MAECEWAIICDYSFLDASRKTCPIGIFDRVFTPAVPSTIHQLAVSLKFAGGSSETVNFRMQILRPIGGGQLAALEGTVQLGETGTAEMQFNIAALPLPDFGMYALNIYSGESLLRTVTFTVARPPEQAQWICKKYLRLPM